MTTEDIATMEPGPEMDAAVAEVLGVDPTQPKSHWPWGWGYSTSRANAIWALEMWCYQHPGWCWATSYGKQPDPEMDYYCSLYDPRVSRMHIDNEVFAPTLALTICRALLLAGREVRDAART